MENIWLVIILLCIVFGIMDHRSVINEKGRARAFLDIWRHTVNYIITAVLIYYIYIVRWPLIQTGGGLATGDFIIGISIIIGIFGWWPYIVKNFTEGIDTIVTRVFKK